MTLSGHSFSFCLIALHEMHFTLIAIILSTLEIKQAVYVAACATAAFQQLTSAQTEVEVGSCDENKAARSLRVGI